METLEAINANLRRRKCRVRLEPSSGYGTIRLRYSEGGKLKRISPGIPLNEEGLARAEALAVLMSDRIKAGTFEPNEWLSSKPKRRLVFREAIEILRRERQRRRQEDANWAVDIWAVLKRLPMEAPYGPHALRSLVMGYPQGSRQRLRCGLATAALARSQGDPKLADELRDLGKGYGLQSAKPRILPSDEEIEQAVEKLPKEWHWCFWVAAIYGARPHEVFKAEQRGKLLYIPQGKTGCRLSLPTRIDWLDCLSEKTLPNIDLERDNKVLGGRWCKVFKRAGIAFRPYDLRHSAAVRLIRQGQIKDSMAARSLGHSLALHTQTYQRWLTERDFEALL